VGQLKKQWQNALDDLTAQMRKISKEVDASEDLGSAPQRVEGLLAEINNLAAQAKQPPPSANQRIQIAWNAVNALHQKADQDFRELFQCAEGNRRRMKARGIVGQVIGPRL